MKHLKLFENFDNNNILHNINVLDQFFMHKCADKKLAQEFEDEAEEVLGNASASNWKDAIKDDEFAVINLCDAWKDRAVKAGMTNESNSYGTDHLKKQNAALGPLVKDIKDLIVDREYCIVDPGLGEWNGGYKYSGMKGRNAHIFTDTLGTPGMQKYAPGEPVKFAYTESEIANMMERGEIAFDKNSK